MSAGAFNDGIYVTNGGLVTTARIQPETITTWNPAGVGPVLPGQPSAQVSRSQRSIGINARKARFKWNGAPPAGYLANSVITLPILTKAAFDALVKATAYAYLGGTLNLVGKTDEKIR